MANNDVARLVIDIRAQTGNAMRSMQALNRQIQLAERNTRNLSRAQRQLQTGGMAGGIPAMPTRPPNMPQDIIPRSWRDQVRNFTRQVVENNRVIRRMVDTVNRARGPFSAFTRGFRNINQMAIQGYRDVQNFNSAVRTFTSGLMRAVTAFLSFSALAISPLILGAIALLGSLTAALGTATMSLGAFGLAVAGAAHTTEILDGFTAKWRDWQNSLADFTAPPMQAFFDMLADNLTKLDPLVKSTSKMLERGVAGFSRFLDSEQFTSWLEDITKSAETMMPNFGKAMGNYIVGLMEIIRAFLPMGESFSDWLLTNSQNFRKWAEQLKDSQGFKDFSDWIYTNAPKMRDAFRSVWDAISDLVWEIKDFGMVAIMVFRQVAEWIGKLDEKQLATIVTVLAGLTVLSGILGLLSGVIKAFMTLGTAIRGLFMMGPIGAIIAAVAAALVLAWKHSEKFRKVIQERLIPRLQDLWDKLKDLWDTFMESENIGRVFGEVFTIIIYVLDFFLMVVGWCIDAVRLFIRVLELIASGEIWDKLGELWSNLWRGAVNAFVRFHRWTKQKWAEFVVWGFGLWDRFHNWLKQLWKKAWMAIAGAAVSGVASVARTITGFITRNTARWSNFSGGLSTLISKGWTKARTATTRGLFNIARSIVNQISTVNRVMGRIRNAIMNFISNPSEFLKETGRKIITGLVKGITGSISNVKNAVSRVAGGITSFFPQSPAKEGPLRKNRPEISGYKITEYLGDGMIMGMVPLNRALGTMTGSIVKDFNTTSFTSPRHHATTYGSSAESTGDTYVFNFDNSVVANERQVEDLFIRALSNAERKGRTRRGVTRRGTSGV